MFVRKVENEDGIVLPFTYIGSGKMEYVEGSKKRMEHICFVFQWMLMRQKIYILILSFLVNNIPQLSKAFWLFWQIIKKAMKRLKDMLIWIMMEL